MSRDRSFPILLLCFFLSGLAALVYETAWTREFAFVFGTSELAIATVLAAYMAGLAAGAAVAGRLVSRISRPVLVYGLLELGIALAALAVPFAIAASRSLYVAVFGGQGAIADAAGGVSTALFYLLCSFLILLLPTAMMGATLPLLARHAVRDEGQIGSRIGLLYGINTAGAVAGTLIAAFVLLPSIGLRATIWAGAGINAVVFLAAWALSRSTPAVQAEPGPAVEAVGSAGRAGWILPLICASGAVSFGYEVLWVRLLAHLVGGSVQAFATMLGSFLGGIALGSAIASRFATNPRRAALGFALAQLGIAALSFAAFAALDGIPELARDLSGRGLAQPLVHTAACMLTLFPAALCIGATFPLAVRILARGGEDAGPASARVYSANTVGSIVGSVAAGFFVLPALGFAGTLLACVAANLLLAGAAALLFEPRRPLLVVAACAGGLALALLPPSTPWKMLRTSQQQSAAPGPVVHFAVGRSATVLLTRHEDEFRLRTNGLPESGIIRKGFYHNRYPLTRWLGALPVLARPDTRTMLVVGLGGGSTVEVVPATVERIDVVELEPEVLEANVAVQDLRWRDPLRDPRVRVHLNDARNALLLAEQGFDAVVSQPSHPWSGGAAHLYTREFFELVRSRLSPEGVFVQWIGLSFVDEELFASLLAALDAVFPYVRVYGPPPGYGILFIASSAPLDVEATTLRALEASPEEFSLMGLRAAEEVSASLLLDEQGVRAISQKGVPNSDGHNRLQSRSGFLGARSLRWGLYPVVSSYDPLAGERPPGEDFFFLLRNLGSRRALAVAESLADPEDRKVAEALAGIAAGNRVGPRRLLVEVLEADPRHEEARAALLRLSVRSIVEGTDPEDILEPPLGEAEWVLVEGWRARELDRDGTALEALDGSLAALPVRHPLATDATRLRIEWRLRSGDAVRLLEAERLAEESLGQWPDSASLLLRAQTSLAAGHYVAGLDSLRMVGERVDRNGRLADAHLRRGFELLRATPREPELAWHRERAERALSGQLR